MMLSLLLGGRGTSCNSVHHLTLLADKMDIEVRVNKDTIQTTDRGEGTQMTFDRKRLEDIFAANQAARLAEIRRQLPVLNQAQSTRDFEELAQKLKVDYKTVQLTEYEIEVRRGKATVRAGRDAQAKGEEEMKTGAGATRRGRQARLRAGRAEQSKAGDTPELAEKKGRGQRARPAGAPNRPRWPDLSIGRCGPDGARAGAAHRGPPADRRGKQNYS